MKFRNITIVSYQFNRLNIRKQPWNYVFEIGKKLNDRGYSISIITDGAQAVREQDCIHGLKVFRFKKIRPLQIALIKNILTEERTNLLLWAIHPKSVVFYPAFKDLTIPIIGFLSHSLYSLKEVISAQLFLRRYNLSLFFQNALIPRFILKTFINSDVFKGVVVLSRNNKGKLLKIGCNHAKVWFINHGMNGDIKKTNDVTIQNDEITNRLKKWKINRDSIVLYMGGPEEIRGLKFLIRSFSKLLYCARKIKLVILLRTDNSQDFAEIRYACEKLNVLANILLVKGILDRETINSYMSICDFVALPFILVPSEIPISILETMSFGKPIIGTDVDGIPELIKDRGIIVHPGDEEGLKKAILKLAEDNEYYQQLRNNCLSFMENYPTWEAVTDKFENLIEKI